MQSWMRAAAPGFCGSFIGLGLGRFGYTAVVPFLVGNGGLSPAQAGYAGAANLAGYFAGAFLAHRLGRRFGLVAVLKAALLLSVASFLASAVPGGFWWLSVWRFLLGCTGAVIMILSPAALLPAVPAHERGRAGGAILTGVGVAIVLASLGVPVLARGGPTAIWLGFAALAALATAASWRLWPTASGAAAAAAAPGEPNARLLAAPVLLLLVGYALDGAGFVPHSLFWVDFVARDLGQGTALGAGTWLMFGVGAIVGPVTVGMAADRIGIGRALVLAFAVKAFAVLLPVWNTSLPALALSPFLVGALSPGLAALMSARTVELFGRGRQSQVWGFATLGFALSQASGGYGFSFAYAQLAAYRPLFLTGGAIELCGTLLTALAWAASRRPAAQRV